MKGKKFLAGLLSVILAFNSNAAVLAIGEDDGSGSNPPTPPAAHTVTIEASSETPAAGEKVTLTASDVEDADSLQWQEMETAWTDIEGETSGTYTFTWTEELETASFRLAASWEGEDESVETVYSGALTLTAAADEPDDPDDEPDDPDDEPDDPDDEPKNPDDEPKNPDDEPKDPDDEPDGTQRDGGTTSFTSFEDAAEAYYGEGGSQGVGVVSVTMKGGESDHTVKAGALLQFEITYTFDAVPTYPYTNQPEPMFDKFQNTNLYLTLPERLSISSDSTGHSATKVEGEGNVWQIALGDITPTASAATSAKFTLNVLVEGNGVLPIGTKFDFAEGEELLYLTTELPILDRTGEEDTVWKTYTKKIVTQSTLDDLTSTTLDKWGITKTAGEPEVSENNETVTVPFTVTIGLLGDEGIVSGSATYGRYGRVPFKSITFTDTPEVKSRTGESITPESITVTPEFGEKKPVTLTGSSITMSTNPSEGQLPIDTCSAHGVTLTNGSRNDAPYYSTYEVEVVYDYDDYFIANYYDANQEKLDVENTAQIEYKLAGETDTTTKEDSASVKIGEVTKPAAIIISKYIVGADGAAEPYTSANFDSGDPVSGSVAFSITGQDGSNPTLYEKQPDDTYRTLTDNTVSFEPNDTGSVTVYLDPGTYVVKETDQPKNTVKIEASENDGGKNAADKTVTVAADGTGKADFYNKETLGSITIKKSGKINGQTSALKGAKFGLYSTKVDADANTNCLAQDTTNASGTITFSRLPYGTYYVKEISAPEGYLLNSQAQQAVLGEGDDQEVSVPLTFTNTYNGAYVKLTKMLDPGDGEYVAVGSSSEYYADLQNAFTLQQKGEGDTWTDVAGKLFPLGSNGTTQAVLLPVYEDDGTTPITYRFAEKLPEGFHGASGNDVTDSNGVRWAYSDSFTLVAELGKGESEAKKIIMKNTRNGSIEVTKNFYAAEDGQMKKVTNQTASFDLYYTEDSGKTFTQYNQNNTPYTTDANGMLTITDLPTSGAGGAVRSYYLVEQEITGYKLMTDVQSGDSFQYTANTTIGSVTTQAIGPFNFKAEANDKTDLSRAVTLTNVEQKVPVVIKKVDSYTGKFVEGAKYKIYEWREGGNYTETDLVLGGTDGIEVPDQNGSFQKLTPGKKYIVFETTVPDRYTDVTEESARIIDLSDVTEVKQATDPETVTLKNRPDPKLLITKVRVVPGGTAETMTGVKFEVYTKKGNSFERVKGYNGTTDLTLTSGTDLQLPAGEYYLKETETPDNTLSPASYYYYQLYLDAAKDGDTRFAGEYVAGTGGAEGSYYFGPIEVVDQKENITKTIANYAAKGTVQLEKLKAQYDTGATSPLFGAEFTIYQKAADGDLTEKGTAVSSVPSGIATFSNLPIFDENGSKITYVIKETKAPDGYTASDESFEVKLEPGKIVEKDTNDTPLTFLNLPTVDFQVTKVYYNMWEHQFTSTEIALPGTVIALYVKDEDGNYTYTGQAKRADDLGQVTFTGLNQKDEYVAIEVSIRSDIPGYEYLEPKQERLYLPWDAEKGEPEEGYETLTQNDLDHAEDSGGKEVGYNYVTKSALPSNKDPKKLETGKLTNVENWAQVHIFKYLYPEGEDNTEDNQSPVNNAEFRLYMEVLDEDTANDAVLKFEQNNLGKYALVGTYSSGTLYNEDGVRQDGWFATDILKSADEVVYWLVEIEPGIGTAIIPKNAVTLIKRIDTQYKNDTGYIYTDGEGRPQTVTCTNVFNYENNKVTQGSIENDPVTGEGAAQYTTVRIAKWAGSVDADGDKLEEYTPLGNAVFELWLVDEKGGKLVQLDTLTTGLDNDLSTQSGESALTAWASSRAFSLAELEQYQTQYNLQFEKDDDGNTYVRAALVESGAPAGYQASQSVYYLYMFFRNKAGDTTETFNDVFYVKGAATNEDLADDMVDGKFGFYPTEEKKQDTGVTYEKIEVEETDMPEDVQKDVAQGQFRLVNWPIDHFSVTVQKYGYEVNDDTLGKTSEELTEYFAGTAVAMPLAGVEMRLERYDSTNGWQTYSFGSPSSSTLQTDASGSYTFPNGLPLGRYRLIETKSAAGYENIYTGDAVTVPVDADEEQKIRDGKAYYFQVTTEAVTVKLYNPAQLSLSVKKLEMDGITPISGVFFHLSPVSSGAGSHTTVLRTGNNGIATFTKIPSGRYKLTEGTVPAGYSNAYFVKWFQKEYAGDSYKGLANFVTTNGISLGFTTELQGGDVVITSRTDLSSYGIDTTPLTLSVRNPETVTLNIEKRDKDTDEALSGAEFIVEYLKFSTIDGTDITITSETTGWETVSKKPTMNGNIYTLSGLTPGIYRVKETKAPDGYDITDSSYHYVALTGGLNVGNVKVTTAEGTSIDVTSYETSNTPGEDNELLFKDAKKVSLTVTKKLEIGSLTVTGNHTFTFKLYEDENKTKQVGTDQTIQVTSGTLQGNPTVIFSGLSQGKTYYLEETNASPGDTAVRFALKTVSDAEGSTATVSQKSGSLYAIKVPNDGTNVSVTATNVYLYAEVCVLKVDGNNGTPLSGADFVVYRTYEPSGSLEEGKNPVDGVTFTESSENKGVYTARIPLTLPTSLENFSWETFTQTFHIREIKSPSGYVLNRDQYVEVTLRPGEKQAVPTWHPSYANQNSDMLQNRIFPNYQGAVIKITKYNNIHDANGQLLANVKFTLYRYNAENTSWEFSQDATTNAAGMVEFKVPAGIYAVEEMLPSGYAGFEGIWSQAADGKPTGSQAAAVTATINATEHTLHRINGTAAVVVGITYQYNAYNIPYVDLEIRKQLVDPSSSTTIPTATVNVYQVANGTEDTLTQAEVEQLMQGTPLRSDISVNQTSAGVQYSTSGVLRDVITPGATYLIVETNSSVPQLRDNKDVVWYKVLHVPADAEEQTVTLKNLDASVGIQLTKTTTDANLTSLFESAADITYTLTPTVTNSYPLTSLTITDNGLAAYHIPKGGNGTPTGQAEPLDFDTYLKNKYSITGVTVPAASHVTEKYADGTYPIDATVTFYGFDGTEIYSKTVDAADTDAARTVKLPASVTAKAKTLSVSYASSEFKAATGYALGQNVSLGDLKLTVHLDQQTATGAEVKAISRIDNDATATAEYAPWGVDGVQATAQSRASDAAASVSFQMRKAAIVSVAKTADKTSVNLGEKVAYTVKITNASAAEAPFIDPFFVDFLPQGSSFASEKDDVTVTVTDSGTGAESSLTLESITANTVSGETGVLFLFDGELKPGGSAEITFEVLANNAVTAYGTEMKNYVIVGSENKGYTTNDNPQGASFKNSNGQWAEKYSQVLSSVGGRITAFEKILGERSGYGYISANANVTWSTSSSVVLVKSAYGDRNKEDGYTTSEISVVDNGGTMHYRLTLSNVSSSYDALTDISIIDLLPSEGDSTSTSGRWSRWGLNFGSITNVYKVYSLAVGEATQQVMTPVAQDDYRVFYYIGPDVTTGTASAFYQNVETLKFDTTDLPQYWTDVLPTGDGLKAVKAFVVAIKMISGGDGVELIPTDSLVIDYTATVNGGEELSPEELSAISYQNAVNSFATHYSTYTIGTQNPVFYSAEILDSNQVTATTLPDPVKVGGHIWIDKNVDGIRDLDESIDNFSDVSIIQELLDKVQVRLFSFSGTSQTPSTTLFDKTTNPSWTANANFIFGDLNAAALNANLTPYQDEMDANNVLNPSKLKGSSPSTYQIEVSFPTTGSDAVAGIFRVTKINAPVLYSRDPAQLQQNGQFYATEAFDNNYKASGTSNVSERFYLWAYPETTFDNTKDIGLVPYRTLEITKTNETGDPLAGAEFAIYGPFDPDAATHRCTEANLVGGQTYTTGDDGKITVHDLLWYMDYVIVEKTAPADYTVSRATATAVSAETNLEKLSDGTWLLKTPADTKADTTDKITVVNRKKTSDPPTDPPKTPLPPPEDGTTVSFTPTVRKAVLGDARSEEATFRFLLTADKNNPTGGATMSGTSVTITGSGTASFGSIVFREPGNYLFYLREDTAQPVSGYAYDAAVWTLRISVAELGDELVLASTPVYEQGGTQRTGDAQFVNTYETPEEPPTEPPTTPPTTPDGGEPVPADIPQTGDETGFLLWLALLVVSGAGLAALGCRRLIARRRIRRANPPQK